MRSFQKTLPLWAAFSVIAFGNSAWAEDAPAAAPESPEQSVLADMSRASAVPSTNVTVNLINRLVKRGVLTKQDSSELLLMAEADAADARAQAAMTQAAIAMAAAAQARARAIGALARSGPPDDAATAGSEAAEPAPAPVAAARTAPVAPAAAEAPMADDTDKVPVRRTPKKRMAVQAAAVVPVAVGAPTLDDTPATAPVPDDEVRVTYVPEFVKQQLREEVKQDVLDDAHKEGWASPNAVPGWITRFTLFGDFRMRYEDIRYPKGNDNTGAFPNFNAINTGAPFDVTGANFSPQINVDEDRSRLRIRARLGAAVDLGQNFSVGIRGATGNDDSPVSENQSLGTANQAQGGDFSKYSIWLDRAFLKYEVGGKPDEDVAVSVGRFDNPFFTTSMVWADDLGFDGGVVQSKYHLGEDITPFFTFGAFPVFNTDLNFASNQPAKFASYDKWLYAAQLGFTLDLGPSMNVKMAVADYHYHNIEGQLSAPFTPQSAADAGSTDDSRPSFAQFGNTYMALRDIVPGPLNVNGTTDQFQYFGLASKFNELAFDGKLDFNQFEPFQISFQGEYVKNLAFDPTAIAAVAVNNRGPSATNNPQDGAFLGSSNAWLVRMVLGDAVLQNRWDWNVNFGYRSVGSDSVVDGFADSDFGGGGTNFKGPTIGGSLALSPDVWLRLAWMSASTVEGPVLKNDILQMDIDARF
jgi:Putative porin